MRVRKIGSRPKPHHVTLCRWARPTRSRGKGRSVALFAFSYRDVAELLGLHVRTVRRLAKRGVLDMTNLQSIVDQYAARRLKIPASQSAAAVDPPSGEFN